MKSKLAEILDQAETTINPVSITELSDIFRTYLEYLDARQEFLRHPLTSSGDQALVRRIAKDSQRVHESRLQAARRAIETAESLDHASREASPKDDQFWKLRRELFSEPLPRPLSSSAKLPPSDSEDL